MHRAPCAINCCGPVHDQRQVCAYSSRISDDLAQNAQSPVKTPSKSVHVAPNLDCARAVLHGRMEQSIPADQYTTKCRFSRVPRVSPDDLAQNTQSPVKTPSKTALVARNGAQTSTVRAPCCMAGWSSRFLRTSTRPNAGFRVFLAYLPMISPRILNLPSKPRPKPRLWREMAPKPRLYA